MNHRPKYIVVWVVKTIALRGTPTGRFDRRRVGLVAAESG